MSPKAAMAPVIETTTDATIAAWNLPLSLRQGAVAKPVPASHAVVVRAPSRSIVFVR